MNTLKHKKDYLSNDKYLKSLELIQNFDYRHYLEKTSGQSELEVFSFGRGEPIALVPPGGMTVTVWLKQIEQWSSDYRLIVIHPPAHGLSKTDSQFSLRMIAKWMLEALSQVEKKPVHLVGASLGGVLAQHLIALDPDRFKSLILINSICSRTWSVPDLRKETLVDFLARLIELEFENLEKAGSTSYYEKERRLLEKSNNLVYLMVFQYVRLFSDLSTLSLLDKIKIPSLAFCGELDPAVARKESKLLALKIQDCARHEIKGSGHFCFATHAQEFNDKAMAFIRHLS